MEAINSETDIGVTSYHPYFPYRGVFQVGEVVCCGTGRYQWSVDDFLSKVSMRYAAMRKSPVFRYLDRDHCLILFVKKRSNRVGLYCASRLLAERRLHVTIEIQTAETGKREYRCGETNNCGSFGTTAWMRISEFMERKSELLCDGKLTVFCELRRFDSGESPASLQETPPIVERLQSDFKSILDSREDCDVTIKVGGKEFLAHRIILRARSPVFKSMFSHEMVEKQSGVVVIDDCDPATFPDLLNYLYTGSTQHVSDENVCQLYTTSDKYQVEELKEECAAYMKKHLSIGNFCHILTLALRHSERELIGLTTEFFCANATEIANSATWQSFLRENPTAGNELFLKSLSRKMCLKPCQCNSSKISK